jgi:hypothetical protein
MREGGRERDGEREREREGERKRKREKERGTMEGREGASLFVQCFPRYIMLQAASCFNSKGYLTV